MIKAPFSPETVASINKLQQRGDVHPLTCVNRKEAGHPREAILVATTKGLLCPFCDYQQDWMPDVVSVLTVG